MEDIINSLLTGGVAVALIGVASQVLLWYLNNRTPSVNGEEELAYEDLGHAELDKFDNVPEIQYIIDRVIASSAVDRFLILKTENGGGKPRLGSHLYSSVMYESTSKELKSVKDDYQRLLVDDIYVRMLSDIGLGVPNKLKVVDMKDGILKNIYKVEGVSYSEVHYIGETDNTFFYLSVGTTNENNTFDDPMDRVEIEIAISKVRNIFKKVVNDNI